LSVGNGFIPTPHLSFPIPSVRKRSWVFGQGGGLGGLFGGLFGGGAQGVDYQINFRYTGTTGKKSDPNITTFTTTANVKTKYFQWKCPAGHRYSLGRGSPFWVEVYANGAPGARVQGLLYVQVMDALETNIKSYFTIPTSEFGVEDDLTRRPTIPNGLSVNSEDLLQILVDGDAVLTSGETTAKTIGTSVEKIWFKGLYN